MEHHGDLYSVHPGDDLLFAAWKKDLPTEGGVFGLGAHSVKSVRKACEVFKPTSILEIGFNVGWSASMWLNLSPATVLSVDISDRPATLAAVKTMKEKYPGRFDFILSNSTTVYNEIKDRKFDLIFIDGDHLEDGVYADIQLGLKLGIKQFVFDDWIPHFGPGTQPAISRSGITVTHLLGENLVLAVVS